MLPESTFTFTRLEPAHRAPRPPRRQRLQVLHLHRQPFTPSRVQLPQQPSQKLLVVRHRREVATVAQQQRLADGAFQSVMTLLDVAVLVGFAGLDFLAFHPVMPHQRLVAVSELLLLAHVVHRRREPIGLVSQRRAAQFP